MKKIGFPVFFLLPALLITSLKKVKADELVIDRFSDGLKERSPNGWELKIRKGNPDISVVEDGGNYALRLRSRKSSFRLEKKIDVDYRQYPIISWRWKVVELPQGGDVRHKHTDDQAAQIYFSFSNLPQWLRTKFTVDILGYIWENLTPAATMQNSPKWWATRYFVLHNGKEKQKIGQWVTERCNIIEDFEKIFGKKIPQHLFGIAIMIDSDDTASSGECYFDDIVFQAE